MRTSSIMWTLATLLVLLGFGWYFWVQSESSMEPTTFLATESPLGANYQASTSTPPYARTTTSTSTTAEVTYDSISFLPAKVVISKGNTVTFRDPLGDMWVASDPDPSHTGYDRTTRQEHCAPGATPSFDQCIPGSIYSFTFTKTGTFPYHDHTNPGALGVIIVK